MLTENNIYMVKILDHLDQAWDVRLVAFPAWHDPQDCEVDIDEILEVIPEDEGQEQWWCDFTVGFLHENFDIEDIEQQIVDQHVEQNINN